CVHMEVFEKGEALHNGYNGNVFTPLRTKHFQIISTIWNVVGFAGTDKVVGIVIVRKYLTRDAARIGCKDIDVRVAVNAKRYFYRIVYVVAFLVRLYAYPKRSSGWWRNNPYMVFNSGRFFFTVLRAV